MQPFLINLAYAIVLTICAIEIEERFLKTLVWVFAVWTWVVTLFRAALIKK